jgi:hypothetical protein
VRLARARRGKPRLWRARLGGTARRWPAGEPLGWVNLERPRTRAPRGRG